MRPDFKLADLPFGTAACLQATPMLPEDFSLDEDAQEATRNLISLARQLKKEEDYMRGHPCSCAPASGEQHGCGGEWQRSVQGAVDVAYDEHSLYYSVQACKKPFCCPASISRSTPDLVCSLASEEGGRAMHCYLQPPNAWACCFKSHSPHGCAHCPRACAGPICDNVCHDSTKPDRVWSRAGSKVRTGQEGGCASVSLAG